MSNVLYLDCASGIAGDMLVAAMLDAGGNWEDLDRRLKTLPLQDVGWELSTVKKNGFAAKKFDVSFPPQHAHRHLSHIEKIIEQSDIGPVASELAMKLFVKLGEAEATVHGSELKKVHFHEVGAIDSIVDIVSIAILMEQLKIDRVFVSNICTGFGTIEIAHGQVAVPAPATALLLSGFPIYGGDESGEMVTPTGASFLAAFASPVSGMPPMELKATGAGAGTKDLKSRANIVRIYLGVDHGSNESPSRLVDQQQILELQFQVDDMSGQQLAHLQERLFVAGVHDCFLTNVLMKKGRPGILVTVHCNEAEKSRIEDLIFENSSTIGIRSHQRNRSVLRRQPSDVETAYGQLKAKEVSLPNGQHRTTIEFSEIQRIANQSGKSLMDVQRELSVTAADKQ